MSATITHVLGARPNFVKAAPVIRALAALGHAQRVVHTGQHYDERMSDVFFVQLGLPKPDVNLGVGSGTQATMTAGVLVGMEREFLENSPSLAVLYGDVNSTVGAALAGAKLGVPLAHVEAGLRSFDNTMPEEINRRLTDQLCDLLFCTSPEALGHLAREGRPDSAMHLVGNPMIDTLVANLDKFDAAAARAAYGLGDRRYVVATLHRPANVDSPERAAELVRALHEVAAELDVIIPLHPRGRATLTAAGLLASPEGALAGRAEDPRGGSPRLHRVHVAGARGGGDRDRFWRRAGGDYAAARALPHTPAEHRAAHHDHQRLQPARHPRRAGGGGAEGLRRRPVRRRAAPAVGRPGGAAHRPDRHLLAGDAMSETPTARHADGEALTGDGGRSEAGDAERTGTSPRTRGSPRSASGCRGSCATRACSWP